jgi:uncharacterized protein YegP (UPF0339 family)
VFAKLKLYAMSGGEFRFELIAANRAILGSSQHFDDRTQALLAINQLQSGDFQCKHALDASGKHCFELLASDGSSILHSASFASEKAACEARQLLEQVAAQAKLIERNQQVRGG